MKKLLALLAVLGLSTAASAAVTLTVTEQGSATVGGMAVDKYLISVAADAGTQYNAVDAQMTGSLVNYIEKWGFYKKGPQNIAGTFHAFVDYFDEAGGNANFTNIPWNPTESGLIYLNGYNAEESLKQGTTVVSNMLVMDTNLTPPATEVETAVNAYSVASYFNAAFAFNGYFIDSSMGDIPMFQIVVPQGSTVSGVIQFGDGAQGGANVGTANFTVPEPATLGLLVIGALGLIRRKIA